jgi:beta-lactamase superfamily II metal-dependent hydrolase
MVTRTTTRRTTKNASHTTRRVGARPAAGTAARKPRKTAVPPTKRGNSPAPVDNSPTTGGTPSSKGNTKGVLRVRMYRIGFGDFFLLTVPTETGPQHILIDCGVHACNINSMGACIQDLATETHRTLALVIATHYHADHISGFASGFAEFAQFSVGAVWITNRLDPNDKGAAKFHAQLAMVANQLQLQFGARTDPAAVQALDKVQNALGNAGGSNTKALQLLTSGFKNKPPVYYYQGGDTPVLPDVLKGALTAQLLGPSPKDSAGKYAASDNRKEQYLAAVADAGVPATGKLTPFEREWPASASDYPPEAFQGLGSAARVEEVLHAAQPDVLAATADALDGTLNNQSLVVLFTCQGKKLLFVGDAQWGNWEYWLYGDSVTGQDPGITDAAKAILGSIDFYKVGHHGSTNATPIPAVGAMSAKCVAMCSTETGYPSSRRVFGSLDKGTEVPRTKLMEALEKQTQNKLVRSDWIAAGNAKACPEARAELPNLPQNFTPGALYIDYIFP